METEVNDSAAPATKADIARVLAAVERVQAESKAETVMVLGELRAFRVWVEGKFELVDQKFQAVGQRFDGLEQRVAKVAPALEELTRLLGWRLTVLNVTLVAAIVGAGAWT